MKATTIFKFIGILFVVIGAVVGIGMLAGGFGSTERPMIFMGVMFLVMFCGIGGLFAVIGFRMDREDKKVLEQGSSYLGKILDYRPDMRVTINGAPALALVIRYYRMGEICEAIVNTGEADRSKYPLGSTVAIRLYEGKAALEPGSVSDMHIEREEDLLNPDFNPNVNISSVGIKCPNCGANITVPYGMSRICPYCDSKITVDKNGRLVTGL